MNSFLLDTYTERRYRSLGFAVATGTPMMEYCRRQRDGRALAFFALENKAGPGLFRKSGFLPVGQSSGVRLGSWQWDWERLEREAFLPILSKIK
jgi:hypothetical protein